MLIRIVKMTFEPSAIEEFLDLFETSKEKIRCFEGCNFLELYRDKSQAHIFFTYSYWEDEAALELYRNSELFQSIWGKTRKLFAEKAEAWSVEKIHSLE